jgi:hypothetical protein
MPWLEALNAPNLGLLVNGEDFAATQDMSEAHTQEISFHGSYGYIGPVLRIIREADEGTISFSAILLKAGQAKGLQDEDQLLNIRDFEVLTRRGEGTGARKVYRGCNWRSVTVRSTLDQVTIDVEISFPSYVRGKG